MMPKSGAPENDDWPIIVGVDGSNEARWALKWAADEARRRSVSLRIVHARSAHPEATPGWYRPSVTRMSPGEAIVDDAEALAALRHPSVVITGAEAVESPASRALITASSSASLLVIGPRGSGGFGELLLGSVSDQCIQHAHCPVVVVHRDPDQQSQQHQKRLIVVGIDGSLGSTRALRWALDEAQMRAAPLLGVHAWQYPPIGSFVMGPSQGFHAAAREILESARDCAADWAPEVAFTSDARMGDAVSVITEAAQDAELLVIGARGHGSFAGGLLGSVAHQVARHADVTVAVVRLDPADHPAIADRGRGRWSRPDTSLLP